MLCKLACCITLFLLTYCADTTELHPYLQSFSECVSHHGSQWAVARSQQQIQHADNTQRPATPADPTGRRHQWVGMHWRRSFTLLHAAVRLAACSWLGLHSCQYCHQVCERALRVTWTLWEFHRVYTAVIILCSSDVMKCSIFSGHFWIQCWENCWNSLDCSDAQNLTDLSSVHNPSTMKTWSISIINF